MRGKNILFYLLLIFFLLSSSVNIFAAGTSKEAGEKNNNVKYLKVRVVAYCLYGYTSTGSYVKNGTIAVDPDIIPMGSKIYVPGYGWGKASDCGGAIQGNIIDIWMPSYNECINWGNQSLTITIIPPKS